MHQRPRKRRAAALVGFALVATLTLSACTNIFAGGIFHWSSSASAGFSGPGARSNQADDAADGTTIAELRPKSSAEYSSYLDQAITWKSCHGSLRCADVRVPIDWSHISADSIRIALVMHPAKGTAIGDLLVNPGGPGGSGVEFVEDGVDGVVTSGVAARYNVVGFDPRGVGQSQPVTCYDDADTDKYFYGLDPGAIGSSTWIAAQEKKSTALAVACEKRTGPVLAHVDSISVAEDMDVIRSALKQPKLDYLGYSYGTYLGTLYAGLFPTRVGKFVLDGADDPWGDSDGSGDVSGDSGDSGDYAVTPDEDGNVAQAIGFEDSLTDYLQACLRHSTSAVGSQKCPFSGGLSGATHAVEAEFGRLTAHPLRAHDGRQLGGTTLAVAIDESLYDSTDWPDLTRMFHQLADGKTTQAFDFADDYNDRDYDGGYYDNDDFANLAIGCLEDGHDVDLKFDRSEAAELKKVAPMLGIYQSYGDLACSGWPYGPTVFPNAIHAPGTNPILVLGTTGDPATPYQDAKDLTHQLDNGHLVTFHGEGHTAYDLGHTCIDTAVDHFLLQGIVPASDPECR